MFPAQIPQVANMTWDVRVQIDSRERSHSGIVVRAEGNGQATTSLDFPFEGSDQQPSDAAPAMSALDHEWMELPHTTMILRQGTDPADKLSPQQCRSREARSKDMLDLRTRGRDVGPATWRLELCHEHLRGPVMGGRRKGGEINYTHGDGAGV